MRRLILGANEEARRKETGVLQIWDAVFSMTAFGGCKSITRERRLKEILSPNARPAAVHLQAHAGAPRFCREARHILGSPKARTDLAQAELPIDAQADDQPADHREDDRAALTSGPRCRERIARASGSCAAPPTHSARCTDQPGYPRVAASCLGDAGREHSDACAKAFPRSNTHAASWTD